MGADVARIDERQAAGQQRAEAFERRTDENFAALRRELGDVKSRVEPLEDADQGRQGRSRLLEGTRGWVVVAFAFAALVLQTIGVIVLLSQAG